MKKLFRNLLVIIMIFSIGMVAFASPRIPPICDVTGLPHEYEYVESGNGWTFICINCGETG